MNPEFTNYSLFPTRLATIQFADTHALNQELCGLFHKREELSAGFNMHPDALNLLSLADVESCIATLRDMFLAGVRHWLNAEGLSGPEAVDLVLFTNYAGEGEFTVVHNHNADLVGVYYAQVPTHDRPPVQIPKDGADYFEPGDGVLVLHDPRFNANLTAVDSRDHVTIYPRPGLMLIFPAYLWHSVAPHRGEDYRLSFSVNVTLCWPGPTSAKHCALP